MSPEKMDRKLLQLAGETGIQLSGVETGETKEMDTAGYVYTPLTLEFVCTDRDRQPDLWKDQPGRRRYVDKVAAVRKR